jgi:hypothetical protein
VTPDLAADLHAAQAHEWIALDLLVAHGMPRDCDDIPSWVASESTAAKAAHAASQGTRNADVAAMLWRNVEAVEAAFALWSRARRVIERCERAEARRDAVTPTPDAT